MRRGNVPFKISFPAYKYEGCGACALHPLLSMYALLACCSLPWKHGTHAALQEKSQGSRLSGAAGTPALPLDGLLQGARAGLTGAASKVNGLGASRSGTLMAFARKL